MTQVPVSIPRSCPRWRAISDTRWRSAVREKIPPFDVLFRRPATVPRRRQARSRVRIAAPARRIVGGTDEQSLTGKVHARFLIRPARASQEQVAQAHDSGPDCRHRGAAAHTRREGGPRSPPARDLVPIASSAEGDPPRTDVEKALAPSGARVLGLEAIGIHDNFFDLGGHSLKATQVVSRVAAAGRGRAVARTLQPADDYRAGRRNRVGRARARSDRARPGCG